MALLAPPASPSRTPLRPERAVHHPAGTTYNDDVLTCTATVTDPDESPAPSYEWSIAGNVVGSAAQLDLTAARLCPRRCADLHRQRGGFRWRQCQRQPDPQHQQSCADARWHRH